MKPFIFQFKEQPTVESADYSQLQYDKILNLSIDKQTGMPAICALDLSTETFTKTQGEDSDTEQTYVSRLMGTESITLVDLEASDADPDRFSMSMLMGTETETRQYVEGADSDPQ
ncbi:hypothetical protein [Pedobacter sp. Hv1]|uniref:hypothetical protein n=1 Tax=Pedobacter sp. Hv1 TaxID=1740090 RepID=UPI0006D8BCA7|nr:hypothetical protein [Pedobacter sp. Hv1]KQC00388.1 hypothetical protein AQF98_12955 [Pedobacter sp. Hv1]